MGALSPRPSPGQVLIVEDEPGAASMYKRVVGSFGNLEVTGVVTSGEDALMLLRRRRVDLMLLDLNLAGADGVSLLKSLRSANHPVEVIAMTARSDAQTVQAVVQGGVVDYLVKPFPIERMRQALGRFLVRRNALRAPLLDQDSVDRVCAAGRLSVRWLPKGLAQDGLEKVNEALDLTRGAASAGDIAASTGLARVTARRYLEYLVTTDQASVEAFPSGRGRPIKLYRSI